MGERMLEGFACYREPVIPMPPTPDHNTISTPIGTRLHRIIRLPHGWRLWLATRDFIYGSYLELFDSGEIMSNTTRIDEGDDTYWVRPSDEDIRRRK